MLRLFLTTFLNWVCCNIRCIWQFGTTMLQYFPKCNHLWFLVEIHTDTDRFSSAERLPSQCIRATGFVFNGFWHLLSPSIYITLCHYHSRRSICWIFRGRGFSALQAILMCHILSFVFSCEVFIWCSAAASIVPQHTDINQYQGYFQHRTAQQQKQSYDHWGTYSYSSAPWWNR